MKRTKKNAFNNRVLVVDRTGKEASLKPYLRRALLLAMERLKLKEKELALTLVSDQTIRKLNRDYRGIDKPTDVLSFQQWHRSIRESRFLGDILIATPTTRKQALAAKKTVKEEFTMLSIHGLLHLLGYDHETKTDAKEMFSIQNRLIERVS